MSQRFYFRAILILTTIFLLGTLSAQAAEKDNDNKSKPYAKRDIADARYGTGDLQKWMSLAYTVEEQVGASVFGQSQAAAALQDRLVRYFESFPDRKGEPISLNLIGLPGIGKSSMLNILREMGFPILHYDAQHFVSENSGFSSRLHNELWEYTTAKKPVIVMVEEVDKIPELGKSDETERTASLIGVLNQILSEGRHNKMDVSNVLFVTTMNFAPGEMEAFTKEVLAQKKSFYDLDLKDFQKFDEWVRTKESARYKILSRMFRSNTVSRFAPNTVVLQPLSEEDYREIVRELVAKAVHTNTQAGAKAGQRLHLEVDPSVVDFLVKNSIYAPSGARETVYAADAIIGQLIKYASKVKTEERDDLFRPRHVRMAIEGNEALIKVTPLMKRGKEMVEGQATEVRLTYNESLRIFDSSEIKVVSEKPAVKAFESKRKARVTKQMTYENRFPESKVSLPQFSKKISKELFGQEETVEIIKRDIEKLLSRSQSNTKEPLYRVLSGFPGIGKSKLVQLVSNETGIPVIRINMQQYSSDGADAVTDLFSAIREAVTRHQYLNGTKPFILQIEELDKAFEISPKGEVINRPVMALIKDLLTEGVSTGMTKQGSSDRLDVRGGYLLVTMNFSVDRFDFQADPRMTTVDDVMRAWEKMKSTPKQMKSVLRSMFLPETVSRLMPRFLIMKPLSKADYDKVIEQQIGEVIKNRFFSETGVDVGRVNLKVTEAYREHLFNESVIPSEGARNTVLEVQTLVGRDLERAIGAIRKGSVYAKNPIALTLDYDPETKRVRSLARLQENPTQRQKLLAEYEVHLKFPPLRVHGKLSEKRLHVSLHEFGHAFTASRLGLRFEQVVVTAPGGGAEGYVKLASDGWSAQEMLANIYSTLASRALERMFFSDDPLNSRSVIDISSGPSQDILQSTVMVHRMLYLLGFDPNGGTSDRNFKTGDFYAYYESLSREEAAGLGKILRDMEDFILKDLMEAHSLEWYKSKIVELAFAGSMTEAEFYKLVEFTYPGEGRVLYSVKSRLQDLFGDVIEKEEGPVMQSRGHRQSERGDSAESNMRTYKEKFLDIVAHRLHAEGSRAEARYTCRGLF